MILCIGEAVIDMFQRNTEGLGDVFLPLPGGCSYNTAIAIGRLGTPVSFLGRLSKNFFGDLQVRRLKENNVNSDFILRCDENPILAFIKTEEGKDPQYAFYEEGTVDKLLSADDLPAQLADDVNCIVFGSVSMNMEPIATTIESFVLKEAANNRVIVFDPNIRSFMIKDRGAYLKRFEKWMSACTIAKISSEDFEYIYPGLEAKQALQKIIDLGARLAIATLGAKGAAALLRRGDGTLLKVSSPPAPITGLIDTVGAGDTFQGALISHLDKLNKLSPDAIAALSEAELNDALAFANKAAAIVCTRNGAEPPTVREIEEIYG